MQTIELFMWGYQTIFQISAKNAAEGIFSKLDKKLAPNVFLIGVLVEDKKNRHPICLEPEDCGYEVFKFADVITRASHLEAIDEEHRIIHSHPIAQENHGNRIKAKALKNAIQQLLNLEDEYRGVISFCSYPVLVEGYKVVVALQLNREAYYSHYSLATNKRDRFEISTSLLDATIKEYLAESSSALSKTNPGSGSEMLDRGYDEVIRRAGDYLMYTITSACNVDRFDGLYETCNTISSLRYEGSESKGRVYFSRKGHPNIEVMLQFQRPVRVSDYRAVRKLLEMSSGDISLLSDSSYIYGMGKLTGIYNQRSEDLFIVNFTNHYSWELFHAEHVIMQVNYRQPEIPKARINKEKFLSDIKRIFAGVQSRDVEYLWELVLEAIKQKHGTMIVVSAKAEEEAERLASQSTVVEAIRLTPQLINLVTAIDGAVLVDEKSVCYAIGVILDGLATEKGSPARGARYNSAVRYIESRKYPCVAIVISEDGSVDLIPDLMPQISKSQIIKAIDDLRDLNDEKKFDFKKFNKTMNFLITHQFYLTPEMCEEINKLRLEIETIQTKSGKFAVRILYKDFSPYEEMNETYFLKGAT
jgi:DNA integrity scanning protein DisA with diadenylate cyclase activity